MWAKPEVNSWVASTLKKLVWLQWRRRGEYSGKDLEAVMSRTVLVKPLASMLRIYPNIYEPGVTCEEVAPHPPVSCRMNVTWNLHARHHGLHYRSPSAP